MIRCVKAKPADTETLARVSERAFHSDIRHGAPGLGGPPGYDSAAWQAKMMRMADYYKILVDDQLAGGMVVWRKGTRHYELGRIFIDPDFQNQGIGTQAMEFLWETYPLAKRWTLDTPAWNLRTRRFYEKLGFDEIGQDAHGLLLFERWTPAAGSSG
jgi:RimJ/RimL family protein N-acetyltransferase